MSVAAQVADAHLDPAELAGVDAGRVHDPVDLEVEPGERARTAAATPTQPEHDRAEHVQLADAEQAGRREQAERRPRGTATPGGSARRDVPAAVHSVPAGDGDRPQHLAERVGRA